MASLKQLFLGEFALHGARRHTRACTFALALACWVYRSCELQCSAVESIEN